MTNHSKNMARISLGGAINALAAVSAHIPCCGSQLIIGVFGAQTLGAISTSYLYQFQFVMPIFISAILASLLMVWGWWHRREHLLCDHAKAHQGFSSNIRNFFILNLVVGYVVVALLYFFVPPHKHYIVDTHLNGYLTSDRQTIFVPYNDEKHSWPWSKRLFVARADQTPAPAQELFWYAFKSQNYIQSLPLVPVHLYARPAGTWVKGGTQTSSPLQFYIGIERPENALLSRIEQHPALVIFYSNDCAPCHVEMNMLPELKQSMNGDHIVVVSLTPPDKTLVEKLKGLDVQFIDASAQDVSVLLRAFNNQRLALPFSFMLDGTNSVCKRRTGLLGLNIIKEWRTQCLQ